MGKFCDSDKADCSCKICLQVMRTFSYPIIVRMYLILFHFLVVLANNNPENFSEFVKARRKHRDQSYQCIQLSELKPILSPFGEDSMDLEGSVTCCGRSEASLLQPSRHRRGKMQLSVPWLQMIEVWLDSECSAVQCCAALRNGNRWGLLLR